MKAGDWHDMEALSRELYEAGKAIEALAPDLGRARKVRDYDGDRRKRCLSTAMLPHILAGDSAASAECKARASDEYGKTMAKLGEEREMAETKIAQGDAAQVRHDTARSLLSLQKQLVQNV